MAIKIIRPDGSADTLTSKAPLPPGSLVRAKSNFAIRKNDIAQQAKEASDERERNLDLIKIDKSLRSSAAAKKFKA